MLQWKWPPKDNKRKAPDSEIEMPTEKKNKTEAVTIARDAVCPICRYDAESISKESNNLTATACCKKFMCQACFDSLQEQPAKISELLANPADRIAFVNTYHFEAHALAKVECPLCRYQPINAKDKPFSLQEGTFEFNNIFNAIKEGNIEAVKSFLKPGFDINATNKEQDTPLHAAVCYGYREIIELLLKHDAKMDSINGKNMTPLHTAVKYGYPGVVQLLLKHGANANATGYKEWTPLHVAAKKGNLTIVQELLKAGASVNSLTKVWQTPLDLAIDEHSKEDNQLLVVKELLKYGALISEKTANLATCFRKHQIATALYQQGINSDFNKGIRVGGLIHLVNKGGKIVQLEEGPW